MPIPLSLYIHIPWCKSKCPYCDFNSYPALTIPEQEYLQALLQDLTNDLPKINNRVLQSIYIGGGTPSLLSGSFIAEFLEYVAQHMPLAENIEISMEANPGTVTLTKLQAYKAAGINRLSLGVQSFQDDKLRALGRIHNQAQALEAINMAKQAGFNNINIDLMHGLPGQTVKDALYDLQIAIACEPKHLSWYQLTIEESTRFYEQKPILPNEDILWQIQQQGQQLINYKQYEVSAYSLPGYECKHNINYWQFGDYLGIGAGAHSKITIDGKIIRANKYNNPNIYLQQSLAFIEQEHEVSGQDIITEFMLNALRLYQPLAIDLFTERTGLPAKILKTKSQQAATQGLLQYDTKYVITTELGKLFLDELVALFAARQHNT